MSWNDRTATGLLMVLILLAGGRVSPGEKAAAEKDPVLVDLDTKVSRLFEGISLGETQNAYQELLAGSRLLKQEKALNELIQRTKQLQTKYGTYRRSERIAAKRIGSDLVLLRYLYKCEDFPIVWFFAFYRTSAPGETPPEKARWRVVTVRFDTAL